MKRLTILGGGVGNLMDGMKRLDEAIQRRNVDDGASSPSWAEISAARSADKITIG